MISLFEGPSEMQETYNAFKHQSDFLHDHKWRRNEATKSYDPLVRWNKYIRDRPDDVPDLENIKLKII